jgi:hypothetical protein
MVTLKSVQPPKVFVTKNVFFTVQKQNQGEVCDIFQYSFTATALTFVPPPRVVVSVFEVEPYETRNGFAYLTSMVAHSVMSLVREGNTNQRAPLLACSRHSIFSVCWTKVKHGHGPYWCCKSDAWP